MVAEIVFSGCASVVTRWHVTVTFAYILTLNKCILLQEWMIFFTVHDPLSAQLQESPSVRLVSIDLSDIIHILLCPFCRMHVLISPDIECNWFCSYCEKWLCTGSWNGTWQFVARSRHTARHNSATGKRDTTAWQGQKVWFFRDENYFKRQIFESA